MPTKAPDEIEVSLATISGAQREKNHQVLQPILTDLIAFFEINSPGRSTNRPTTAPVTKASGNESQGLRPKAVVTSAP